MLKQIVKLAIGKLDVEQVWLFGSRKRRDHSPQSDIDLAFTVPTHTEGRWSEFVADVDENARTLLHLDLVNMARCDSHLRQEILATGELIYERRKG